ncbi:MAG: PadR family transcriptional regulator [Candidatus Thorarchaeota archaeon]
MPHFPPPPMPFGPGMIKEMSQLVFLWTISEEKEGITGYDLQKDYDAKQTNVYRTLKEMEDLDLLSSEETIEGGRAQKLYRITEKGREHLKNLREKWTTRIAFLTDIIPPENFDGPMPSHKYHNRVFRYIDEISSKEEALVFLNDLKKRSEYRKKQLESRTERIDDYLIQIDNTINDIQKNDNKDKETFQSILRNLLIRKR